MPNQLCDINLKPRKQADHHAGQHRGQHDVSTWILRLFGQRGYAIQADVRKDGNGCASEEPRVSECLWIVERAREEIWVTVRMAKNVAGRGDEHDYDNGAHGRSHARINPRRRFDAAYIQQRKNTCEEDLPSPYGQAGCKVVGLLRAPDRADEGGKHVVHHHAPAADVARSWVDFLGHIRERGTGDGRRRRHPPVADPRKQHSYHGDENGGLTTASTPIASSPPRQNSAPPPDS